MYKFKANKRTLPGVQAFLKIKLPSLSDSYMGRSFKLLWSCRIQCTYILLSSYLGSGSYLPWKQKKKLIKRIRRHCYCFFISVEDLVLLSSEKFKCEASEMQQTVPPEEYFPETKEQLGRPKKQGSSSLLHYKGTLMIKSQCLTAIEPTASHRQKQPFRKECAWSQRQKQAEDPGACDPRVAAALSPADQCTWTITAAQKVLNFYFKAIQIPHFFPASPFISLINLLRVFFTHLFHQ